MKELTEGKNLVPVKAEDVGVEAPDDYTVRIGLTQPVPFFVKILPHNFFRFVPEKAIEQFGKKWTQPGNIVSSGAFRLKKWNPYDEIAVEKNLNYWDAAGVRLEEIYFYPVEEQATVMNLYKAGAVDATYNRSVPRSWLYMMQEKRDYSPYANFFENLFSDFKNHKIMWFDRKTKFRKGLILKEVKF